MPRKVLIRFWRSADAEVDAHREFLELCDSFPDAKATLESELEKLAKSASNGDLIGRLQLFNWVELIYLFLRKSATSDEERGLLEQLWGLFQKPETARDASSLQGLFRSHREIGQAWATFFRKLRKDPSLVSRWKSLLKLLVERVPPKESWSSQILFRSHGFEYLAEICFDVERNDDCNIVTVWRVRQL